MTTVFVIEDGEYSDYHVAGVFSTRENAELALQSCGGGEIAEWVVDPAIEEMRQGLSLWEVEMLRDGSVEQAYSSSGVSVYLPDESERLGRVIRRSAWPNASEPDLYIVQVWAAGGEQAIKSANERRSQFIAAGKWDE